MTVKELKTILENVSDDCVVGYTLRYEVNENWHGTHKEEHFREFKDNDITLNLRTKELSLFKRNG